MKKKPLKSIALLLGYFLTLIIVFKVFAIKADHYYDARNQNTDTMDAQTINGPFHHLVITNQNEYGVSLDVRTTENAPSLMGWQAKEMAKIKVANDTLYIDLKEHDRYSALDLLIQQPLLSMETYGIPLTLPSSLFDRRAPVSITMHSVNSNQYERMQLQMDSSLQDLRLNLVNCTFSLTSDGSGAGLHSLDIHSTSSLVEFKWDETTPLPVTSVTSDAQSSFNAPSVWLRSIAWSDSDAHP